LLFYNSAKLGFISQEEIGTVLRDINTYVLYYKAPNLTAQSDTIYLNFFACHLKAGSSDYQQRNTEIQQAKFYMNSIASQIENVFIGGDMNVYSGFESAILTLKNTGDVPLFDPIDVSANWSNDWTYADIHTQSTRTGGLQGGAGGGMDDRFDLIFNGTINSGTNSAVPDSIANALYYASDHLPVIMDVVLDETAKISESTVVFPSVYYNYLEHSLNLKELNSAAFRLKLFDLGGSLILDYEGTETSVNLPSLPQGIYLVKMRYQGEFTTAKVYLF
jgi:hypothetical protein